jgi:hypothetical protein
MSSNLQEDIYSDRPGTTHANQKSKVLSMDHLERPPKETLESLLS